MDKLSIKKNVIDMEYSQKLQERNIWLTLSTIGVFGFFSSFIWFSDRLFVGLLVSSMLLIFSFIKSRNVESQLEELRARAMRLN